MNHTFKIERLLSTAAELGFTMKIRYGTVE